jgi:hypothetical protein
MNMNHINGVRKQTFKLFTVNEEKSVSYLLVSIHMAYTHTCVILWLSRLMREKDGPTNLLSWLFGAHFVAHILTFRCNVRKPSN